MKLEALLEIRVPLLQAPMAGVQGSALAIAVSNAGGLGALPCAMLDPESMRRELAAIRAGTRHPFNVNFFCHTPPERDAEREHAWRAVLTPYFAELGFNQMLHQGFGVKDAEGDPKLGFDPLAASARGQRLPFSHEAADVLAEFEPPVVSFHFGLPTPDLLDRVRRWGAKVLASATTVEEAYWLEAHGVDVIIAQGVEAGGHRGMFLSDDVATQVGTFALVPQIARAVRVPVIAAGGIADAAGVRAAMALGAAGVQVGTAYLLCPEATTSAVHRAALKSPTSRVTAITNVFTGKPARGIVNRIMREHGPMNSTVPAFPLAASMVGLLRATAESTGRDDFSPLWAGQNATGCKEMPAAELTLELARGFE